LELETSDGSTQMHPCPLCDGALRAASEPRKTSDVLARWARSGRHFSQDVVDSFAAYPPTILYHCAHCGVGLFLPTWVASNAFYNELQAGSATYYLEEKWEYSWALTGVRPGDRVLDVGCGAGRFLELVRGRGATGVGVETGPEARAKARSCGFDCHDVDVMEASAKAGRDFDVVCGFQVLEHVSDPVAFTAALAASARPGGVVFIAVPNAAGSLRWLADPPSNLPPHHLSRWTEAALRALADRVGLGVVAVACEPLDIVHHRDHLVGWWTNTVLHGRGSVERFYTPSGMVQRIGARGIFATQQAAARLGVRSVPWIHGHTVAAVLRKPA
jgi:2-polyprenyl-3-methyl-5-hydroxy-6-metoxy-1,4-benzoquinol methylase